MTFASLGWGTWWVLLVVHRIRGEMPDLVLPELISCSFAVIGLVLAFWCLRGRRSWLMFVMVPVLANGSLLMMPGLAYDILR